MMPQLARKGISAEREYYGPRTPGGVIAKQHRRLAEMALAIVDQTGWMRPEDLSPKEHELKRAALDMLEHSQAVAS